MTTVRPIKPIISYISGKMDRQWGALTGLGEFKIGTRKRAKLEMVDTGLNLIGRLEINYLRLVHLYNKVTGQQDEVGRLPLEKTRVKLGKMRGEMKVNSMDGQALNHSPDHVCFLDLQGKMTWLNATMINGLGYETSEVIGRDHFDLLHPEDRAMARQRFTALVETGHSNPTEARFRKNGSGYIWGWIVGRVLTEKGKPVGVVLTIRDVTERKEKEIRMIVNERLRFLKQIWLGMNHEFNNAFAPILVILENINYMLEKGDQGIISRNLTRMAGNADRIRRFTDRLQYFLRFSGQAKVRTDLRVLVDNVVELMQERVNSADITLRVNYPRVLDGINGGLEPELFLAELHFDGVQMVLMDLLNNAVDAIETRRTGDNNAPRTINVVLDKEFKSGQKHYLIAVTDTGCGIKPDDLDKIFTPFFTTKPAGQGTGLGMTIVQQIIKEHGGTMTVSSEPDSGTKIILRLPVDPQQA
jgi:PAS domain S-box-containing protein